MFQCRICSENPFKELFGFGELGKTDSHSSTFHQRRGNRRTGTGSGRGVGGASASGGEAAFAASSGQEQFLARNEEEIAVAIEEWEQYVHPRALQYFGDDAALRRVLTILARCTDRRDDPVNGGEDGCVHWYGDVSKPGSVAVGADGQDAVVESGSHVQKPQAVFNMIKPGDSKESVTYVNRVLAFTFAAEESFQQLMKLPKVPFKMTCNDQLCVHLAHISLETWDAPPPAPPPPPEPKLGAASAQAAPGALAAASGGRGLGEEGGGRAEVDEDVVGLPASEEHPDPSAATPA